MDSNRTRELLSALLAQPSTNVTQQMSAVGSIPPLSSSVPSLDHFINALAAASFRDVTPTTPSSFELLPDILSIPRLSPDTASSLSMQPPPPPSYPLSSLLTVCSTSPASRRLSSLGTRRRPLTEREKFVVFMKIFLKYLKTSGDPNLPIRVKAIVNECTCRHRMGDANYAPLQRAVERRLRRSVGELHWTKAKNCCDRYCRRSGIPDTLTAV